MCHFKEKLYTQETFNYQDSTYNNKYNVITSYINSKTR